MPATTSRCASSGSRPRCRFNASSSRRACSSRASRASEQIVGRSTVMSGRWTASTRSPRAMRRSCSAKTGAAGADFPGALHIAARATATLRRGRTAPLFPDTRPGRAVRRRAGRLHRADRATRRAAFSAPTRRPVASRRGGRHVGHACRSSCTGSSRNMSSSCLHALHGLVHVQAIPAPHRDLWHTVKAQLFREDLDDL